MLLITTLFQFPVSAQISNPTTPSPTAGSGPPVLSSISPSSAAQGTSVTVTLTGSNFSSNAGVRLSGAGARQGNVVVISPTTITATFTFLPTTAVGNDNVYVVTASGNSNILPFAVTPASTAPVSLSVSPKAVTLNAGGSQQFTATVTGTTNTGVTWALSPPNVGAISASGLYTAPASLSTNSSSTVTVTATSVQDKTASTSAQITLKPSNTTPVSLSVSPKAVSLNPGGSQQFTATVTGTANTGVTWALSPPSMGAISASGLYTAPASLSNNSSSTVTITATSVQDKTASSSAQITLKPSNSSVSFTMGTNGLTSLTFNGQNFLYAQMPRPGFANVFQTDPQGNMLGLGVTPSSTVADPVANTVTQTFGWGKAVTQYQATGNKLLITVTLSNTLANPITRYWMFPLGIQLPATPLNFSNNTGFSLDAPATVFFDYGSGTIDLADEDIINPMAMSFWQGTNPAGPAWLLSLYVDPNSNLNPNWPGIVRPIAPGGSDTITLSLRFGAAGQTEPQLVSDLFARYAATFPRLLPPAAPRKPIARLTLTGRFRPTFPTNPRGWFNDPTVDVTTPAGIANFHQRLLQAGDNAVAEMTRVGAIGGIIWDIEGQQFDQAFLGDPVHAEQIAPELVGVIDQFMAKFTNAGFQIGFDVEPQVLSFTTGTVNVSGNQVSWTGGSQFSSVWVGQHAGGEITIGNNTYIIASVQSPTSLTIQGNGGTQNNVGYTYALESNVSNPEAVLASKVAYTRNRWGATLFYTDKDLTYGGTFITQSQIFEDITQQYPGTLFFPEWAGIRHYAYTYPFLDSTNGVTEPPAKVTQIYPQAAGLVRVPDDQNIQAAVPALIQSVSNGNILLFDGWYRHPGNDTVIQIYQQAP